ncbi:reverse transcriptase [Holotrichia oblita]|uniref:Reverse transcriptase n=1 Tax=Holotrichia oblita TaxID=644536 RepID=A0ACB9TS35_HOLOL|nr:reverse transcriptase [Holotrichia oblita]
MCSAANNIILYGGPVWGKAVDIQKYNRQLQRLQRNTLLRVASAYWTASGKALQVVTDGVIPIDPLIHERTLPHKHRAEHMTKAQARNDTISSRQERWNKEVDTAQWTKRIIVEIRSWINCRHRHLDYYLTQALTGHGVYRSYVKRFRKDSTDSCIYCGMVDTVEHTIFVCVRGSSENRHLRKGRRYIDAGGPDSDDDSDAM